MMQQHSHDLPLEGGNAASYKVTAYQRTRRPYVSSRPAMQTCQAVNRPDVYTLHYASAMAGREKLRQDVQILNFVIDISKRGHILIPEHVRSIPPSPFVQGEGRFSAQAGIHEPAPPTSAGHPTSCGCRVDEVKRHGLPPDENAHLRRAAT